MTIEKIARDEVWKAIRDVVERCCQRVYDHPHHPDLETDLMVHLDMALLPHLSASYRAGAEGWQPIETAPKDGTHILLAGTQEKYGGLNIKGRLAFSGYWDPMDEAWCSTGSTWEGPFYNATHWMPLPPLPLKEEG